MPARALGFASGLTIPGNVDLTQFVGSMVGNITAANSAVSGLRANVTATNAAIITANVGMKTYVDTSLASALIAASSYGNSVVAAYLPVNPTITAIQANVTAANVSITAANSAANTSIIAANSAMRSYVDTSLASALIQASSYGNSVVAAYLPVNPTITAIQANVTAANASITAANASIATKADLASPDFTGTPTAPTATFGNSHTSIATTAFVQAALAAMYPIGSIYTNASVATNPATLLGFGTWTAFAAGEVMVGFDSSNALFDTAGERGGSANAVVVSHTHTATVTDPGHFHSESAYNQPGIGNAGGGGARVTAIASNTGTKTTGITVANSTEGVSGANANYQPYITVYMWKRTA